MYTVCTQEVFSIILKLPQVLTKVIFMYSIENRPHLNHTNRIPYTTGMWGWQHGKYNRPILPTWQELTSNWASRSACSHTISTSCFLPCSVLIVARPDNTRMSMRNSSPVTSWSTCNNETHTNMRNSFLRCLEALNTARDISTNIQFLFCCIHITKGLCKYIKNNIPKKNMDVGEGSNGKIKTGNKLV